LVKVLYCLCWKYEVFHAGVQWVPPSAGNIQPGEFEQERLVFGGLRIENVGRSSMKLHALFLAIFMEVLMLTYELCDRPTKGGVSGEKKAVRQGVSNF
jgi:hypothetical protein